MTNIHKVAVFGASGNLGAPITAALRRASFAVTAVSRADSPAVFPPGLPVVKVHYTLEALTAALAGQDAAVSATGPGAVDVQDVIADAAAAAGVRRLVVNDFGWGPGIRGLEEFAEVRGRRAARWEYARARAEGGGGGLTWTGISVGNPIDWALQRFPTMGFDIAKASAVIYDQGNEYFTGTTLEGIGQSVVGVLRHPDETANRFVTVMSVKTCQRDLLAAFAAVTGAQQQWDVEHSTTRALLERGRARKPGWVLDLAVAQLLDEGEARCLVAPSREESDSELLGVVAEAPAQVAAKALGLRAAYPLGD